MFTSKFLLKMHITIKNLGIVETAEIELNGLTIVTGHNDSGKSFIGKMIFSIIKTIQSGERYSNLSGKLYIVAKEVLNNVH